MMKGLRERIRSEQIVARPYESMGEAELIPERGDWVVEFQFSDEYIRKNVQKSGWHRIKESWWVPSEQREYHRLVDMTPRPLEPLVGSRVPRVMSSARSYNDIAMWRFLNVVTGESIPGEICE